MKQQVLAAFREWREQGRPGRIVVPTATLAEHLRHELVREGLVFRPRDVTTLHRFVQELAPESAVVSDDLFHLMVADSLRRLNLPEFRKVADLTGFHTRLSRTISDLDAAGCTPSQIGGMRASVAPFRDPVAAVWRDVERQMHERTLVMRGESLRVAAASAREQTASASIWFYGFAQLSAPEKRLIDALGSRAVVVAHGAVAQPAGTVVLVPETAEREVEEIARRIIANPSFRDTGVVLRKPEKYLPLLRAAFERFGIPAHFYFKEPLSSHPATRLLTGTVSALLNGWEHEQILDLLRFIPRVGTRDALDEFAVKVRGRLPGRGLESLLELAGASFAPQRVLKNLQQIDPWRGDRRTAEEWAARLNHLPSLFGPGPIPDHVSSEETERLRFHAAGLAAFAQAMETAAGWWVAKSETITLERFWEVARSVVGLATFGTEPRSRNVVQVISAWEARQWDLGTLFVCGMVQKDFPAQNARDPFFSDAALREIGARTSEDKDSDERALFEEVCSRARNLLVLSYPRTDARGQRNLKSIFLVDREEETSIPVVRPLLDAPIAQWTQPSQVKSQDLLSVLAARHQLMTVTSLETLLQCPFQFFANKTLRIEELPCRPEDRLDFLQQGNIAHEVLKEWFEKAHDLDALFERVFSASCEKNNIQPGFRTDRLRRLILINLRNFTECKQYPRQWAALVEQPFELAVDDQLRIRGRLDRIDQMEDGRAVVIDYKFSNVGNTKNRVEDETKLQGPLYAWAAEQQFGRTAAAMVYINVKGGDQPKYFGWGVVPGAALKDLKEIPPDWIAKALVRASKAAAEFRAGVIHPHPATNAPCRYCDYRDACRVEQPAALPATVL